MLEKSFGSETNGSEKEMEREVVSLEYGLGQQIKDEIEGWEGRNQALMEKIENLPPESREGRRDRCRELEQEMEDIKEGLEAGFSRLAKLNS